MNNGCNCGLGGANVGIVKCPSIIRKSVGLILVPIYANDGVRNSVTLTSAVPFDLSTLIKNVDPTKRGYPLLDLKNVAISRSDTQYRTFTDNSKEKTQEGIYSYSAMVAGGGVPSKLVKNLVDLGCDQLGIYIVTKDGKLVGYEDGNEMYPIAIEAFDPYYMFATDEGESGIMIQLDLDNDFQAGLLYQLPPAYFTSNLLEVVGLYNAVFTELVVSTTSIEFSVSHEYGEGRKIQNIKGLLTADFTLFNNTTDTAVTITTLTETPNEKYTASFVAQTVADKLTLSTVISSTNYEGHLDVTV
jgi:hypothetical protein